MNMRVVLCPVFLLLPVLPAAIAQPGAASMPTFTADAPVVLVPATVMDRKGAPVTGLSSQAFTVSQDNVRQTITSFGEEDAPVSVGIVFDASGSMRSVLGQAKNVIRAFLDASNPGDEALLDTVSTRPEAGYGFTRDVSGLLEHTIFTGAGGSTALVDTIYSALLQTRQAHHPRRALLIVSDGMDNHSRYSKSELMAAAVEADLQIYSISVYDPPRNKKPIELREERNGISFLEELTRKTGGVQVVVHDALQASQAATAIARVIRSQYLIGYVPESIAPGRKWHRIDVSVNRGGARALARSGFYSK